MGVDAGFVQLRQGGPVGEVGGVDLTGVGVRLLVEQRFGEDDGQELDGEPGRPGVVSGSAASGQTAVGGSSWSRAASGTPQ
ncbi:hypothetical protein ACFQ2M_30255 [Kitasatospora saccharophila]|uniref:hypothetical protein n=1 Tax=Kitasatospora saccharophila TaxID=407973 RepID=UPI0036433E13